MKLNELNKTIEETIFNEVKRTILNEMMGNQNEVYHIKCDGEPIATFDTEDEAGEHLDKYKKEHPGKELIIEKGVYESHDDMISKFDQMGEELEENNPNNQKENKDMENTQPKFKSINEAIRHAKSKGIKKIKIMGESYDVDKCYKEIDEVGGLNNEEECKECGTEIKEQDDNEWNRIVNGGDDGCRPCKECGGKGKYKNGEECEKCEGTGDICDDDGGGAGDGYSFNQDMYEETKKDDTDPIEGELCANCDKKPCECDKKPCECDKDIQESKKKTVRLSETELVNLIGKIVKESVPGLDTAKRMHTASGKINAENLTNVTKEIKRVTTFDGNDNPEFPKPIGKGETMAINNTEEEDEFVEDNRGKGLQNLQYDHEPSDKFKERLKKSLEGDSTMGNSQESGNSIKTDTGKNLAKQAERKDKKDKDAPMYNKDPQPVKIVKESKMKFSNVIGEEINKMRNLTSYSKKTQ